MHTHTRTHTYDLFIRSPLWYADIQAETKKKRANYLDNLSILDSGYNKCKHLRQEHACVFKEQVGGWCGRSKMSQGWVTGERQRSGGLVVGGEGLILMDHGKARLRKVSQVMYQGDPICILVIPIIVRGLPQNVPLLLLFYTISKSQTIRQEADLSLSCPWASPRLWQQEMGADFLQEVSSGVTLGEPI